MTQPSVSPKAVLSQNTKQNGLKHHDNVSKEARMADPIFEHPRLAGIYDALDSERNDLALYVNFARKCEAVSVLDVGCGTGSLAVLLAQKGMNVVGVDPAAASLEVARAKPFAERITWVHGFASDVPQRQFDLATMTANVAQAIADPDDWMSTLTAIHDRLSPTGFLVFESRVPARRAWEHWNKEESHSVKFVDGVGRVESWVDLLAVDESLVSFRETWIFEDGETLTSDSTLRFREEDELTIFGGPKTPWPGNCIAPNPTRATFLPAIGK
jgi:SAM-dependent methyltransferase